MWTGNEALSKCEVRSRGRRPRRTEHLESAEFTVAFSESFLCEIFGNRVCRLMRPWSPRSQSKTLQNNLFFSSSMFSSQRSVSFVYYLNNIHRSSVDMLSTHNPSNTAIGHNHHHHLSLHFRIGSDDPKYLETTSCST